MNDFLILMKSELVITLIIFLLLFIKIGKGMKNETLLSNYTGTAAAEFYCRIFFQ